METKPINIFFFILLAVSIIGSLLCKKEAPKPKDKGVKPLKQTEQCSQS